MKRIIFLYFLLLMACRRDDSGCPVRSCTKELASILVEFTDKDGEKVEIEDFNAVNVRTGDILSNSQRDLDFPGYYVVVNDTDIRSLSQEGDNIEVTGRLKGTDTVKSAIIKVSGGCACHIKKISGPEKIIFD